MFDTAGVEEKLVKKDNELFDMKKTMKLKVRISLLYLALLLRAFIKVWSRRALILVLAIRQSLMQSLNHFKNL